MPLIFQKKQHLYWCHSQPSLNIIRCFLGILIKLHLVTHLSVLSSELLKTNRLFGTNGVNLSERC